MANIIGFRSRPKTDPFFVRRVHSRSGEQTDSKQQTPAVRPIAVELTTGLSNFVYFENNQRAQR